MFLRIVRSQKNLKGNVPFFKKGNKDNLEVTDLRKILKQIIKQNLYEHFQCNNLQESINLTCFFNRVTSLTNQRNAVDILYLTSEKHSTKSQDIHINKMIKYRLDATAIRWIQDWLSDDIQKVVLNSSIWT